ncbi:MAG: phospholipid/cholesterol/gamma-HCH transport system substrate-binding protein [Nocardioidaceae bacterium]|nr:phospholipid/cholesterol/gamma-HCH transport system substrate-binding protein [Nocardioidaceae bacterium]
MNARRTWKRMKNVPGLGRNVAVIAVIIAMGTATMGYVFSQEEFVMPGSDRVEFEADFTSAANVSVGQAPRVRIAGVVVGKIVAASVTKDGNARLKMSLKGDQKVYGDAHLVLRPKSVLNEMYVDLDPGSPAAKQVDGDAVIPVRQTETSVKADAILEKLDARTQEALSNLLAMSDAALANAPANLPKALDSVTRAGDAFGPVAERLATRRKAISELVTALAQIADATGSNRERTASLAASLETTLGVVAKRDGDLAAALDRLPGMTDALRDATGSLQGLTTQLNPTLDNIEAASDTLPSALSRFTSTITELGKTAAEARPVVKEARPLVNDLVPMTSDARASFQDLRPLSQRLDPATATLLPYLAEGGLQAFIYNTSAVFRDGDANGGYIRGHLIAPLPDGGVIPGTHGGNADPTRGIVPWS